jgi:shikimate kinase
VSRRILVCGMSGPGKATAAAARFLSRFDAVVLLSAPVDVLVERLAARETDPVGKDPAEPARILDDVPEVEPLPRRVATHEVDTARPLEDAVAEVERIGRGGPER